MVAKVIIAASLFVSCLALPAPDKPTQAYRAPANQYSEPEPTHFQPQPQYSQPEPQYSQPEPQYRRPQPRYEEPHESLEPPKYNFDWAVKDDYSGNDFGHQESRDGYDTKGAYYVLLPDGRRQTVTYYVTGDSGFIAQVEYEGEPRYDQPQPSYSPQPQPSYQPQPQPSYQPQPQPSYQPQNQYGF